MTEFLVSHSSSESRTELPDWLASPRNRLLPNEDAAIPQTTVVIGQISAVSLHGMGSIVAGQEGFRQGGLARNLDDFLAACKQAGDGIALADPLLSREGTRAFVAAVKQVAPRLRLLLVSDMALPAVVRAGIEEGALGFLCTHDDLTEFRAALDAVARGRRYLSRTMAEQLSLAMSYEALTPREMDVLRILSKGCCNKSLARELDVTVGTVKTHLRAIMCKLAASSRTDTLLKAGRLGLVHV